MIEPYFTTELGKLYHGDSYSILNELDDNSISLVVMDPPYDIYGGAPGKASSFLNLKKYINNDLEFISHGFDEQLIFNTLQSKFIKGFNCFCFCSNKQISKLMQYGENKNYSTTLLVWHKTNATPFCHCVWKPDAEFIVHIREHGATFNDCNSTIKSKVYSSPILTKKVHPTVKPLELISNYIKIGSNENDTILDPFAGSGTTAYAAEQLNRKWICIEKEEKYCEYIASQLNSFNIDRMF